MKGDEVARDGLKTSTPMEIDGLRVWVKRYESGRVRVILPEGYEVKAVVNGGNTNDLQIELMPKQRRVARR